MRKLKCVMLIDDNPNDNFFHERVIKKCNGAEVVVVMQTGESALEYLRSAGLETAPYPSLIFLDVNMPRMNGWEFLEAYERQDAVLRRNVTVVILSTSENPDDRAKAANMKADFMTKPLTPAALEELIGRYPNL